jgi:hypothetical protein
MMYCKRCQGRVFIDRIFFDYDHLELFCIRCSKRWVLHKSESRLAKWINRAEKKRLDGYGTSF